MLAPFRLAKTFGHLLRSNPLQAKNLGLRLSNLRVIRFASGGNRADCGEDPSPRCSPENIAKTPCKKAKRKQKKREKPEPKSMWLNPECCKDPCPDVLPRFDELYYKISDKAKRKYRQTWAECPELKIRKRVTCCFDQVRLPPLERRPRKCRPVTACPIQPEGVCKLKGNAKCPKTTMPCCRGARDPPHCAIVRKRVKCKKICAPYPSFSECKRPKPRPLRPVECDCLRVQSMCEVWAELRRIQTFKK